MYVKPVPTTVIVVPFLLKVAGVIFVMLTEEGPTRGVFVGVVEIVGAEVVVVVGALVVEVVVGGVIVVVVVVVGAAVVVLVVVDVVVVGVAVVVVVVVIEVSMMLNEVQSIFPPHIWFEFP